MATKSFLITLLTIASISAHCQTIFETETFGSGDAAGTSADLFAGDMGTWTVENTGTNGASANNWYVSGEECGNLGVGSCGIGCSGGDNTLHISAIGGLCATPDCGAAYDESGLANQTNKRAMSPTFDCTGLAGIVLNFEYIAAQGDDGFWVEYSTDGGTSYTTFTGGAVAASNCCDCFDAFLCANFLLCCGGSVACTGLQQGEWTNVSLSFPAAADDNANVKFAFHWSNDGDGVGTDPSVAIDNITVTNASVLGVELVSFEGESRENLNTLTWSTMSEKNFSHYEIEHTTDNTYFRKIGEIKAGSKKNNTYSFVHQVSDVMNYYRLKMIDKDGSYTYSELLSLKNDLSDVYLVRNGADYQVVGLSDLHGSVSIYDLGGKVVSAPIDFDKDQTTFDIDKSTLKSGVYIVRVMSNRGEKNLKIQVY